MKDKFSVSDVNNMRREALVKAGVIPMPEGYHMMPDGTLMSDSDMLQDLHELNNAGYPNSMAPEDMNMNSTGLPTTPGVNESDQGGNY